MHNCNSLATRPLPPPLRREGESHADRFLIVNSELTFKELPLAQIEVRVVPSFSKEVVIVGIYLHIELHTCLNQCINKLPRLLTVYVIVSHSVTQQ